MRLKTFTIEPYKYSSGGIIEFTYFEDLPGFKSYRSVTKKEATIQIVAEDSLSCITELLQAIFNLWTEAKQLEHIKICDDHGWHDIILINYPPGDVLKIEIYRNVGWDYYEEGRSDFPEPIFIDFTAHKDFASFIVNNVEKYGLSIFAHPQYPYPEKEIQQLKDLGLYSNLSF